MEEKRDGKNEIRINTQEGCWWLTVENYLDSQDFVIHGNKWMTAYENAKWYKDAKEYLSDLDCYGSSAARFWEKLDRQQKKAIIKVYDECVRSDDDDTVIKVAMIANPGLKLKTATIRGYCQGDWQNLIYDENAANDVELIESIYFGKVADVSVLKNGIDEEHDEEFGDFITDDELWRLEREGNLKEELCKRYELNIDDTKVYVSDGIIHTTKWKEVG